MLSLIDLDIESLGYDRFISAWLHRGQERTYLVDPGPAATIDRLLDALAAGGVETIDRVLLTHIHLDHAGATGHLLEHFPEARVVCHEKAIRHLADPRRLMEGSRKVLGRIADVYGDMRPVDEHRMIADSRVDREEKFAVLPAPGHAPHHLCFVFPGILFVGELLGVFHALENGYYLRPATPPRFAAKDFFDSMDRIEPYADRRVCFGHHGSFAHGREILAAAREQLALWIDVIASHWPEAGVDRITKELMQRDPLFAKIDHLSGRQRERELYFAGNSIRGIGESLERGEAC